MAQTIIPGNGGVWVLVEENAPICGIGVSPYGISASGAAAEDDDGIGKGALAAFLAVVGMAAIHLVGG